MDQTLENDDGIAMEQVDFDVFINDPVSDHLHEYLRLTEKE